MQIVIPTYKRDRVITLENIPDHLHNRIWIVVAHDDQHRLDYPNKIVMDKGVNGMGETRHWIAHHTDDEKLLMLDDDLQFFCRKDPDNTYKLRPLEPDEYEWMFAQIDEWLDDYAHGTISARGGNNNVFPDRFRENERCFRVLAHKTAELLTVDQQRLPAMTDFDVTLQLLRRGYPNFVSYYYAQEGLPEQAPGGCSEFRTIATKTFAARRLRRLHPEFVRCREKKTKSVWGEGVPNVDVIIQWKKAYESSKKD